MKKITLKMAEKIANSNTSGSWKSKELKKKEKKFVKKHGFSYLDVWNLDTSIAAYVLPRLVYLRDNNTGYPEWCLEAAKPDYKFGDEVDNALDAKAYGLWIDELDKMINAFYEVLNEDLKDDFKKKEEIIKIGLESFGKNFRCLWD